MRHGAELVRASQVYAKEDLGRSWYELFTTLAVFGAAQLLVLGTEVLALQLLGSVVAGLTGIRLFIFFHDWNHGAIFRKTPLATPFMWGIGLYTLSAPSVWKETHDYHHRNNAKLVGSAIGSYPTVSLRMYRRMDPSQRRQLRAIRHPLAIGAGLFTTFLLGMCLSAFQRDPRRHWVAGLAPVVWMAAFAAEWWFFGPWKAVLSLLVPGMLHSGLGSYLFYAQHNFPEARLYGRREWTYANAALESSSFFAMSPWMHWFTGNIGYHHVHHLNHRIPFYRLPEAMAAMPELQTPGTTSWRPRDVWACLQCSVWDERDGRLISFADADAQAEPAMPRAAK